MDTATKKQLYNMYEIIGTDGIWDSDKYMLGMFNGMEILMSIIEDRLPRLRNLPTATEEGDDAN